MSIDLTSRGHPPGTTPPRDLADHDIEDRDYRQKKIDAQEARSPGTPVGLMCITVEPGERLGELFLNTQFEARPGDHDGCQAGQNRVMVKGGGWLRDLLDQIAAAGTAWEVDVYPVPCPKTSLVPPVERAVQALTRTEVVVGGQTGGGVVIVGTNEHER